MIFYRPTLPTTLVCSDRFRSKFQLLQRRVLPQSLTISHISGPGMVYCVLHVLCTSFIGVLSLYDVCLYPIYKFTYYCSCITCETKSVVWQAETITHFLTCKLVCVRAGRELCVPAVCGQACRRISKTKGC